MSNYKIFKQSVLAVSIVLAAQNIGAAPTNYDVDLNPMPGALVTKSFKHKTNGIGLVSPYGYYQSEFPSLNDLGHIAGRTDGENSPYSLIYPSFNGQAAVWAGNTIYHLAMTTNDDPGCPDNDGPDNEGDGWPDISSCGSRFVAINNSRIAGGSSQVSFGTGGTYPEKSLSANLVNGEYIVDSILGYSQDQSQVQDINNAGAFVGSGITSGGAVDAGIHGLVVTNSGNKRYIGEKNQTSLAHAVNENLEVTGGAYIEPYTYPITPDVSVYIWKENGTDEGFLQFGGTLDGGNFSEGFDINDAGLVVGRALNGSNQLRAFKWQSSNIGGALEDLGTLGGDHSVARSINNAGTIVGMSKTSSSTEHAFIYQNGKMYDLNDYASGTVGYDIVDAYSINENGQILVRALKKNEYGIVDNKYWLLTPGSGSLLSNGDFEQGELDWTNLDSTDNRTVLTNSSECLGGAGNCLKIDGIKKYRHVDHLNVGVNPSQTYFFSGHAKVSNLNAGNFKIHVKWLDAGGSQISKFNVGVWNSNSGAYVKREVTKTAPSNAASMRLEVVKGGTTNTGAEGYFDDIKITSDAPGGNTKPIAKVIADTYSGDAPLVVNFDGSQSSDAEGDSLTYTWDFGDGATESGAFVSHTYQSPGSYSAKLTVSDGSVSGTDTATILVDDPTSGGNILSNGDFEGGQTDWTNFGADRTVLTSCSGGTGSCLRIDGASQFRHVDHINTNVNPSQSYVISGSVKVANLTSGNFKVLVRWLKADGSEISKFNLVWSSNSSNFVVKTTTKTAPSNAAYMQVEAVKSTTNTGATGYFDNITVE